MPKKTTYVSVGIHITAQRAAKVAGGRESSDHTAGHTADKKANGEEKNRNPVLRAKIHSQREFSHSGINHFASPRTTYAPSGDNNTIYIMQSTHNIIQILSVINGFDKISSFL